MKITLVVDEQYEELEVHIYTSTYNEQIQRMMDYLKMKETDIIDGYIEQEIHMLKVSDIYFIYAEGAKVYFQTDEQEYESKRKLYELEKMLEKEFVRINKSMLINIDKISSMKMERIGMMELVMDNESTAHVSRMYLKGLKKRLGIGRE